MIDRSYTLVTGPAGSGKTSLIEALVASNRARWLAAVRVAEAAGPLLMEETREVGRIDGRTALNLALGLNPAEMDDDEDLPYGLNVGDVVDEDDDAVETVELPPEVSRVIRKLLKEGRPSFRHQRWLRRDLHDLWKADLVVVGTDGPDGGEAAGRLREEILAVRRDKTLRREVTGPRGDWPPSCFVADLRDRSDDGTRKVVQAVKRRWRWRSAPLAATPTKPSGSCDVSPQLHARRVDADGSGRDRFLHRG